jgi:hypothetical protein
MDSFFLWIEAWPLGILVRESPSIWGFPFILVLHTVGLAFMVGVNVAVDVRALGYASGVPLISLRRYYRWMWAGFWVNAMSGVLLLIAYPIKAMTNPVFYLKLALIAVGIRLAYVIRRHMLAGEAGAGVAVSRRLSTLAAASLVVWFLVITTGRLLAYTCTRLTVDTTCG